MFSFITVELNIVNISFLVLSIIVWILSIILNITSVVILTSGISCKPQGLLNFQVLSLWLKITYTVLLTIEFLFLLIVLLLWIAFSVILETSNS